MYITEVEKVNGNNMSTTLYDTLDVEFSSSTNGVFKKSNSTDTLKSFTWNYERRDELLNPNLKCISFFTVGYIRETSYKVVENKRNKECWQSTDWDFMSGRNIKTEIILIRK